MKRAAAYIRVSTDKSEQLASLANQREILRRFCADKGYELIRIYADEGVSGRSLKNRREFIALLNDSGRHIFDVIVLKDISRFSRNVRVALNSIYELRGNGVKLHFLNDASEMSEHDGMSVILKAVLAEEESKSLSMRVKASKKLNAERGRVPTRVYGYDRIDNFTLSVNGAEAGVVRELFRKYAYEGWGCRRLALWLRSSLIDSKGCRGARDSPGAPGRPGAPECWSAKTVRRMLSNPIYAGILQTMKSTSDFDGNRRVALDRGQWIEHARPEWAIVDAETWDKAQEVISRRREIYKNERPRYSGAHLFSNLIICGKCGRSFIFRSYTYAKERRYYICAGYNNYGKSACDNTHAIDEPELAGFVSRFLAGMIREAGQSLIRDTVSEFVRRHLPRAGEEAMLEKEIRETNRQAERYKAMFVRDLIGIDELDAKLRGVKESLSALEGRLFNLRRLKSRGANDVIKDIIGGMERIVLNGCLTNPLLRDALDSITVSPCGTVTVYPKRTAPEVRPSRPDSETYTGDNTGRVLP